MKNKGGRPTKMTPEVQQEILDKIVEGRSLVKILSSSDKYPEYTNFCKFLDSNEEFRQKYVRAKEDQADYLADDIMDIADDADPENVQVAKLRVDTRKWIASKLKPKKYGDKMFNEHGGLDGKPIDLNLILTDAINKAYAK